MLQVELLIETRESLTESFNIEYLSNPNWIHYWIYLSRSLFPQRSALSRQVTTGQPHVKVELFATLSLIAVIPLK